MDEWNKVRQNTSFCRTDANSEMVCSDKGSSVPAVPCLVEILIVTGISFVPVMLAHTCTCPILSSTVKTDSNMVTITAAYWRETEKGSS